MKHRRKAQPSAYSHGAPSRKSTRCPPQSNSNSLTDIDINAELKKLSVYKKTVQARGDADLQEVANGCTQTYKTLKNTVIQDSVDCASMFKDKWTKFLEPVPFKLKNGETCMIPKIISVCSGTKTREKIELANQYLIDWQSKTRLNKKRSRNPYYQPGTQAQHLRTFFGTMK